MLNLRIPTKITYLIFSAMAITVVINTYDSARHLSQVLDNLKGFDEIVVCDMGSSDSSLDIAREAGAKTLSFMPGDHAHFDQVRMTGIRAASSEWVLIVEPDELVTPELHDYLYKFIKNPGDVCGLYIPRKNYIFHIFRHSQYPGYQLRFLKRGCTAWPSGPKGGSVVKGAVERIPARRMELALVHIPRDLSTLLDHLNRYTSTEAQSDLPDRIGLLQISTQPFLSFLNAYILKGAWRYGVAGYISAKSSAVYRYYTLAKRYEELMRDETEKSIRRDMERMNASAKNRGTRPVKGCENNNTSDDNR
jgi:beta 1,4 glucosyltransferase